jgi:hypothetical protein
MGSGGGKIAGTVGALNGAAGAFGGQAPVVARLAEIMTVGQHVDTGNADLDGLITGLLSEVAGGVADFGRTLQSDQDGLSRVATGFATLGQAVQWPAGDG